MKAACIFCDNRAGSREHLWPKWIHERVDVGALKMERYKSGEVVIDNPEITVKSVCGMCNNGWMSDLEANNIPIIGSMLADISITLDSGQQKTVAAWAVKTAMMLDSTRPRTAGPRFYSKEECVSMRESLTIPPRTRVWIGRIATNHLLALGTDTRYLRRSDSEPNSISSVVTLVAGHFVVQTITQHIPPKFIDMGVPETQPKAVGWDDYLAQIWPIARESVAWPPDISFTNGGENGISYLMDRWRIGEAVEPGTINI